MLGRTTVPPTKKPYVYSQSRTLGNTAQKFSREISEINQLISKDLRLQIIYFLSTLYY